MAGLDRTESPLLLLARQGSSARISRSSVTQKDFKVILIGSSGVGKSSLCRREALDEFGQEGGSTATSTTIQTEKFTTTLQVRQEPVELELFDTVGQERFMTLSTVFYRKANAVLICFDGSETRTSFDQVGRWFLDAERHAPSDALILLVRTKTDLPRSLVSLDECKQKASALGVHFFETSAKTGHNVKAMFHLIASQLSEDSRTRVVPPPLLGGRTAKGVSVERKPSASSLGSAASQAAAAAAPQASSCWSTAFNFANTSEDDDEDGEGEDEDDYEAEGLAEVILKHASLRAVSVAGGLKRRHTNEYHSDVTAIATTKSPLRTCTLGCGAITSVPTHEQDECWLREVECSLRCGQRFPMLDCAAHEREACECRVITCACGDKIQVKNLPLHVQPENGDEPPQTKQEMIHLLTSLFPKAELLRNVNLREVKSARVEDLDKALLTAEARFKVDCAIVKRAAGYSTVWTEEEDVTGMGRKPERLTLSSVVSLQRRNMLMRPPLVGPSRRAKKREPHDDAFASLWQDLIDCKISPNYVSDGLQQSEHAPATSRDVQVPLTLGSRVVTVRTIDFADLQELNSTNKLGVGSFGSVYLAKYRGARVAVKHLHFQNFSERELLREAAVMTSCCHHPHILRFLGVCLVRPNICFVSEALLCSLEDWLRYDRRNTHEPLGEILRYAEEAASGLFHLHLESVVHRDIAARNLLLDTGTPRRVKVCDFGLARVVAKQQREFGTDVAAAAAASPTNLTGGSFDMTGPLKWMAPECLKSTDGLNCFSFASDVYSFAITLWELLSRDAPYPLLTSAEAAAQVLNSGLRPPKAKLRNTLALQQQLLQGDATSSHLVFLLERAWDGNPVNRPTMRQLCSELGVLQDLLQK